MLNEVLTGPCTASIVPDATVGAMARWAATPLLVPNSELEPTAAWPWPDLAPSDFGRAPDGNLFGMVSAEQAEAVLEMDGEHSFIATGSDGVDYVFRLRPLLPDEAP